MSTPASEAPDKWLFFIFALLFFTFAEVLKIEGAIDALSKHPPSCTSAVVAPEAPR